MKKTGNDSLLDFSAGKSFAQSCKVIHFISLCIAPPLPKMNPENRLSLPGIGQACKKDLIKSTLAQKFVRNTR
jgi:hypothetical protein